MGNFVNDLIDAGSTHASPRSPVLLRGPTPEPIRFALPNVDEDYDSDNENQRYIVHSFEPHICIVRPYIS